MFSFFKKSSLISFPAAEILQSDMHNHVLPGIDDGSPDIESSMELIGTMVDAGYKKIVATPHIYKEFYPNSRDTVSEAFDTIVEKVKEKHPQLSFSFAAEYFLDEHFEDLLDQKVLMPFRDNHVLIEQGFFAPYKKLKEVIFNIQTKGYVPVLAHPERYPYYYGKPEKLQDLQENGVLLQLNLLAFAGRYGKEGRQQAEWLLSRGLVSYLGTDAHRMEHLQLLSQVKVPSKMLPQIEACFWE